MPDQARPLGRRTLLAAPAALTLAAAAPRVPARPLPPVSTGLNHQAAQHGRFYGSAIDDATLRTDAEYMAHVPVECGVVVSESSFKWAALHPRPDSYDFAAADRLMAYASRHRLAVRGHCLAWQDYNPDWLAQQLTPGNAERILTDYIRQVAGHFRGRLIHWDVVNEAISLTDNNPLGLRDGLWYHALGPRYIDIAFHACAETDPHALRFINEYGLDYMWPDQVSKRHAMLDLLADLVHRGVPVQALGMQAHLEAGVQELDQNALAQFCRDVASLGLRICITEMDVRDNREPGDIAIRDAAVAAQGKAFLDAVLDSQATIGVVTWGLSDRRSWLNQQWPRADGLPQRPLPLDTEMNRKPLWTAIGQSLTGSAG